MTDGEISQSSSEEEPSSEEESAGEDVAWMQHYKQLRAFYHQHGSQKAIPFNTPKNKALNYWVRVQRRERTTMPRKRKELLDRIDFDWTTRRKRMEHEGGSVLMDSGSDEENVQASGKAGRKIAENKHGRDWLKKYEELRKFQSAAGTSHIPCEPQLRKLYFWANTQRKNRRTMPRERRKLLERIGFDWKGARGIDNSGSNSEDERPPAKKIRIEPDSDGSDSVMSDESDESSISMEFDLPSDKIESMETYLEISEAQLRDKRREVKELAKVTSRIRKLLEKARSTGPERQSPSI
jgi:hypothetical protein